ncbi:MAG: NAD-dependent epimerase/dehydratase family protein [Alphaproteobacteria bacterium]|nr:NAD-dependent epimerase/dehydratase family protein [Alphaproteobacteria bacterium]
MSIVIITGSAGLIGSEAVRFFADKGFSVLGIDNDMRRVFFGDAGTTSLMRQSLEKTVGSYRHVDADIRDESAMEKLFQGHKGDIDLVVHCAAQPSHDWAAHSPMVDFSVNANGTLVLLEMTRRYAPDAPFVHLSTNKVYGDTPNRLPLVEQEHRWELDPAHPFAEFGIDESMSIDASLHSLFGVSKAASDLLVQEYGRYFGMKTVCFRGGCLTGPNHAGVELHGFLSYLMKCATHGIEYKVFGYKGKQVRDNIHSHDLVNAIWSFYQHPRSAEIYNVGGGRECSCSVLEAIKLCEKITGRPLKWSYIDDNRSGDHMWWITDMRRFRGHYPEWRQSYDLETTLTEIHQGFLQTEGNAIS